MNKISMSDISILFLPASLSLKCLAQGIKKQGFSSWLSDTFMFPAMLLFSTM